jgi:hypothetical protein
MREGTEVLLARIHKLERKLKNAQDAKRYAQARARRLDKRIRDLTPDALAHRRWLAEVARLNRKR